MTKITRKFTFDDFFDFERPPEPVHQEPEGPPPIFTEVDLAEARSQGFEEGRVQALVDHENSDQYRQTMSVERIADSLVALGQAELQRQHDFRTSALGVAIAALRKVLPELTRRSGRYEIEALAAEILAEQSDEPRLVFRVPDSAFDSLAERIATLATERGFGGKTVVIAEPGLGQADCRIEWADGGIERLADRTLGDIAGAIVHLSHTTDLSPKPHEPETEAEIFPSFEPAADHSGD